MHILLPNNGSFYRFSYLSGPMLRQKHVFLQQFQQSICLLIHNMWKASAVECHHRGPKACVGGFFVFWFVFLNSLLTSFSRNYYFSYKNENRQSNDEFLNPQRIHSSVTSSPLLKNYLGSFSPRLDILVTTG